MPVPLIFIVTLLQGFPGWVRVGGKATKVPTTGGSLSRGPLTRGVQRTWEHFAPVAGSAVSRRHLAPWRLAAKRGWVQCAQHRVVKLPLPEGTRTGEGRPPPGPGLGISAENRHAESG